MKGKTHIILSIVSVAAFLALLVPTALFIKDNKISRGNRLIDKAKDEYFRREFLSAYKTYEQLIDSTDNYSDEALINYANAAFMSSDILKGGFYGRGPVLSDTVLRKLANESTSMYTILTTSQKSKIASIAFNQLGYSSIKGSERFESEADADSLLVTALENFKQALKKNPNNDSARYNYELLKKVVGFPETVLSTTKALVAQQRYIEAANLLETSMERDIRLKKQAEFLKRIKAVAGIDTTYTRRRL